MGIYKKDGVYWTSFTECGVRFRKSLECRTRREADKKDSEVKAQAKKGLIVANPTSLQRMDFGEVLDIWLEDRRHNRDRIDKAPLAEKTIATERERAVIVKRYLGHLPIRMIQPRAIEDYIAKRETEVSNGTINRELDLIRGTLKKADRVELAAKCKNRKLGESIGRAFSQEEKARLLAAASRTPERQTAKLALILALNTSMRPVEIKSLQWRDVDWMDRTISLRMSKTKAGIRTIPINDASCAVLTELRERARAICGDVLGDDWYLFFSDQGGGDPHVPVGHWRTAWKSILKEAGVSKCRFYDSRHTVVTELLQDPNVSEETAKSIVGHVSKKMLERYSHQRMGPKRNAVAAATFGTRNLGAVKAPENSPIPEDLKEDSPAGKIPN
jgi:integrase